ncbi:MAG: transglycosylase SLT domain-containing protein [Thiolinea sp.]
MDKLIKLTLSLVTSLMMIFSLLIITTYSPTASAAGCQVLSKKTLERKAKRFKKTIRSASNKYGVSEDLIKAVITVESCFRRKARGAAGEKGLMQLMPATARRFRVRRGYNSWENVHGGTRYLSYLLKRYKGDARRAVAAYNAGEGNVKPGRRIRNIGYVNKVMRAYGKLSKGKRNKLFNSRKAYKVSKRKKNRVKKAIYKTSKNKKKLRTNRSNKQKARSRNTFLVKRGHTVYEVMRQTGVPVKKIIRLNRLRAPFHLKTGQRLRLR